jgi:hypothetical protein
MVTFDMVPGEQGEGRPQFACPQCRAIHHVAPIPSQRILAESVKVRRS